MYNIYTYNLNKYTILLWKYKTSNFLELRSGTGGDRESRANGQTNQVRQVQDIPVAGATTEDGSARVNVIVNINTEMALGPLRIEVVITDICIH